MRVIPLSLAASAELAVATLAVATAVLVSVIIRIVLCVLAASATRKALEDPVGGQADADAIRAHRLAVLQVILAALSLRGNARPRQEDTL